MNPRCIFVAALLAAITASGCVSTAFVPVIESPKDPDGVLAKAAEVIPKATADGVMAIVAARGKRTGREDAPGMTHLGDLPDGLRWEGDVLVFDPRRYELLGTVRADMYRGGAELGLWLYPYNDGERGRVAFCAWQVPLSWVTLTGWRFISPLYWPCGPLDDLDDGEAGTRQRHIVTTLRRATKALGGDLVIAVLVDLYVGEGDYQRSAPRCRPSDLSQCEKEGIAIGGYGFALRRLAR